MAAQENHDNVVKFLLANGANQSLSTEVRHAKNKTYILRSKSIRLDYIQFNQIQLNQIRLSKLNTLKQKHVEKYLLLERSNYAAASTSVFTPEMEEIRWKIRKEIDMIRTMRE